MWGAAARVVNDARRLVLWTSHDGSSFEFAEVSEGGSEREFRWRGERDR